MQTESAVGQGALAKPTGIRWRHDIILIGNMAILAACGLIYEYLLSHYAGRIIGAVEAVIYAMIGVMIVSMGVGAFAAKWIKDPFRSFVVLELLIAILGGTSILLMSAAISLSYETPSMLQAIYGVSDARMNGGLVGLFKELTYFLPFVFGFLLGGMIGMEIPLVARVRERVYRQHLEHNTGTIYGADYIGAGVGAALWVMVGLRLPIVDAAVYTAALNIAVAIVFLFRYGPSIEGTSNLWVLSAAMIAILSIVGVKGEEWSRYFNSSLFVDEVVYSKSTPHQHLTLTYRHISDGVEPVMGLYINGGLQFSQNDEHIYHQMLVTPAMLASARHDRVLLIGGGDGLALRDVLKWNPQDVTIVDLDKGMTDVFSGSDQSVPGFLQTKIRQITEDSFQDSRVTLINEDAFLYVDELISAQKTYDVIIVDLPDPRHPNLGRLYSDFFYNRLSGLLAGDGAIVVQSTSPYHAKNAFISIGKTLEAAGYGMQQYHANVPTFGEWGWTLGVKTGASPLRRIQSSTKLIPGEIRWITKHLIEAAFVFPGEFYRQSTSVEINTLGTHVIYQYHHDAWSKDGGIYMRGI